MMIFKETTLESAKDLIGVVGLEIGGSGAAPTGAEGAGEARVDEAVVAISIEEVETDLGESDVAVKGAAVETDVEDADSGVAERVNTV